jgi:hypothetical protein
MVDYKEITERDVPELFDSASADYYLLEPSGQVEVSANREEDEPWRLCRLSRIVGFLMHALNCDQHDLKRKHGLLALRDHKGCLGSTWLETASFKEASGLVTLAWEREGECSHTAKFFRYGCSFYELR